MEQASRLNQVFGLMSQLGCHGGWDKFEKRDLQALADTPRLTGAHFREFLRCQGRVSLKDSPIGMVDYAEFGMTFSSWEQKVDYARRCIGNSHISSGSHDSMVKAGTLLKPEGLKNHTTLRVLVLTVMATYKNPKAVLPQSRILELFELHDAYPTTVPEAFAMFNVIRPTGKRFVLFNACRNDVYGNVDNMLITKPDPTKDGYSFGPIGGDIDDPGLYGTNNLYLATEWR